jgi:hypothetical protein
MGPTDIEDCIVSKHPYDVIMYSRHHTIPVAIPFPLRFLSRYDSFPITPPRTLGSTSSSVRRVVEDRGSIRCPITGTCVCLIAELPTCAVFHHTFGRAARIPMLDPNNISTILLLVAVELSSNMITASQ